MNSGNQSYGYDEKSILPRASTGDLESFNQLVLQYQDVAYNHAYALLGDLDLAEDATQESFIKAFQHLSSFREGSFRGWLLRIVTNSAYDLLRRFKRHPTQRLFPEDENGEEIESPFWIADRAASVQATVEQHEISRDLSSVLDELPDVYRSVLTLVDVYELDYVEVAEALSIPLGTVKSRLARARIQMQKKLKDRVHFDGARASLAV
jgi:RNA polymerase sigma-70 factor (ECF subfamily)